MSDLVQLFLAGFASAFGPCLLVCSPVVIPFIAGTRTNIRQGILAAVSFSLARLLVFMLLGALVALLGAALVQLLSRHHTLISISVGVVVALLGVVIMLGRDLGSEFCRRVHQLTAHGLGPLLLGLVMGLVPCAARLGILGFIAVQGHTVWRGSAMALAFGLGEAWSPIFVLSVMSGWLPRVLNQPRSRLILARVSGFFVLLIGLRLIVFPGR